MEKLKIYLETSVFNFCVDESRGIDHKSAVKLFSRIREGRYEAFTSSYVIDELDEAQAEKRYVMKNLLQNTTYLYSKTAAKPTEWQIRT